MSHHQNQVYQNTLHSQILKERPIRAFFYDSGPYGIRMGASIMSEFAEFFFNPMLYDGSMIRQMKRNYETNEAGFMIGSTSFILLVWMIVNYRRTILNQQKKIFVYQEYQKRRYLQKALGLRNYTKNYDYFNQKRLQFQDKSLAQK